MMANDAGDFRRAAERVDLAAGMILADPGVPQDYAYFPDGCVVCLLSMLDGETAETATVGSEGVVGLGALLGDPVARHRALVPIAGPASRVAISALREAMQISAASEALLLAYIRCFLVQVQQSAACNCLHSVEQRAARWLLMASDRVVGYSFPLTHRSLAKMLGLRRPSVTNATLAMQQAGLIRYSYGMVSIIDRAGLEKISCPCYRAVRDTYNALLSPFLAVQDPAEAAPRPETDHG